jgi:hypothetical protein
MASTAQRPSLQPLLFGLAAGTIIAAHITPADAIIFAFIIAAVIRAYRIQQPQEDSTPEGSATVIEVEQKFDFSIPELVVNGDSVEEYEDAFVNRPGEQSQPKTLAAPQVLKHSKIDSKDPWWRLQMKISDVWVPAKLSNDWKGVALKLVRRGEDYNPRLSIEASFVSDGVGRTVYHTAVASLHLDGLAPCRDVKIFNDKEFIPKARAGKSDSEEKGKPGDFEATFNFFGSASTQNVFNPPAIMPESERRILDFLTSLRSQDPQRVIHFKIGYTNHEHRDEAQALLSSLGRNAGPQSQSFYPYRPTKSGRPLIVFNSIKPVNELMVMDPSTNEEKPARLLTYPAQDSFRDVNEYVVHQAYGEYQEWEYQRYMFEGIRGKTHKVSFVAIQHDVVVAKLKLEGLNIGDVHTSNHVTFRIDFLPVDIPHVDGRQTCKAIVMDDSLHLARPGKMTLLVVNKTTTKLPDMFSRYPDSNGPQFECFVEAIFETDHITNYLAALHMLNETIGQPWSRLFVNADACAAPETNPSDAFTMKTPAEKQSILSNILTCIDANDDQKSAITALCTKHRAKAAVMQAAAGTGKTVSSSACVQYFLEIGAHVICIATSNAASDKFLETVQDIQAKVAGSKLRSDHAPLRLHRWKMEKTNLGQWGGNDDEPSELTGKAAEAAVEYTRNAALVSLSVAMYRQALQTDRAKSFARPQTSVSFATLQAADEAKMVVLGKYPQLNEGDAPNLSRKNDTDMMAELRSSKARLQNEPMSKWPKEDGKKFIHAFEACVKGVISTRKCLVTTPIMVTKKVVTQFAQETNGVVVIVEEASMARDPQILVTLLRPRWAKNIVGILLVGDRNQTGTLVTSARQFFNAFGRQLELSLFERLENSGFPAHHLTMQYRAHPTLIEFPNHRCYNRQLQTPEKVRLRQGNPHLEAKLMDILKVKTVEEARLAFIDVDGAETFTSDFTKSRSCLETAVWVRNACVELVLSLEDKAPLRELMVVMSFYSDQVKLIQHHFRRAIRHINNQRANAGGEKKQLTMQDFPAVSTVDSYQGDEKAFVMNVVGISAVESVGDLGFVKDDKRANVACTRAKLYCWTVGSRYLPCGPFMNRFQRVFANKHTGLREQKLAPYICDYTLELVKADRMQTLNKPRISDEEYAEYSRYTKRTLPEDPNAQQSNVCMLRP